MSDDEKEEIGRIAHQAIGISRLARERPALLHERNRLFGELVQKGWVPTNDAEAIVARGNDAGVEGARAYFIAIADVLESYDKYVACMKA